MLLVDSTAPGSFARILRARVLHALQHLRRGLVIEYTLTEGVHGSAPPFDTLEYAEHVSQTRGKGARQQTSDGSHGTLVRNYTRLSCRAEGRCDQNRELSSALCVACRLKRVLRFGHGFGDGDDRPIDRKRPCAALPLVAPNLRPRSRAHSSHRIDRRRSAHSAAPHADALGVLRVWLRGVG